MYTRETEIRHLSSADVFKIGQILEQINSWKKLMRIIPKVLPSESENVSGDLKNVKKYNQDHIRLIENASVKQNRMSTEILFDEWGTSGRIRPTIGDLLELLIQAELFRAADFVSLNFLNEPPPQRPEKGPAAKVDINIDLPSVEIHNIEKILDDMNYPRTNELIQNAQIHSDIMNKDFYEKVTINNKKIDNNDHIPDSSSNTDNNNIKYETESLMNAGSTLILSDGNLPDLSKLISKDDDHSEISSLIKFSSKIPLEKDENVSNNYETSEINSKLLPEFNLLMTNSLQTKIENNNDELPNLSIFNGTASFLDDRNSINDCNSKNSGNSNATNNDIQSSDDTKETILSNLTSNDEIIDSNANIPCLSALNFK